MGFIEFPRPLYITKTGNFMQKNAFHGIWTLLSRKVLRGIRTYGCNKVQEIPFCAYNPGIPEDHNRKKREWRFSIG